MPKNNKQLVKPSITTARNKKPATPVSWFGKLKTAILRNKFSKYAVPGMLIFIFAGVGSYILMASKAYYTGGGTRYNAITPIRIADTRPGSGLPYAGHTIAPSNVLAVQIAGKGGVPSTGVRSVVANVTAIAPTADTYLTIFNSTRPETSSLVVKAGQVVNSQVTAIIGSDGVMRIANMAGHTNVVIDVVGYNSSTGDGFHTVAPTRIADTRAGTNTPYSGKTVAANGKLDINIRNISDWNLQKISQASSVVLSVTFVNPQASGYSTVFVSGAPQPKTSSINFYAGQNISKEVNAQIMADGGVSISNNSHGTTDVIVDVVGFYTPESAPTGQYFQETHPDRITDTRNTSGKPNAGMRIGAGGTLNVSAKLVGGIPHGASSIIYSLTALNPTAHTYLTTYPSGTGRPNISNLSAMPGQPSVSQVTTKLGTDGSFNIFNAAGTTDVLVDVVGFYYGNYNALSWFNNHCPEGTSAYQYSASGPRTIYKCIARGSSTPVPPIAGPCSAGYYITANGWCRDEFGNAPFVSISNDGCQVTGKGAPGTQLVIGASRPGAGGSSTFTIPASGTFTGSSGGMQGMTSFGEIKNSTGTILAKNSAPITSTSCPPASTP